MKIEKSSSSKSLKNKNTMIRGKKLGYINPVLGDNCSSNFRVKKPRAFKNTKSQIFTFQNGELINEHSSNFKIKFVPENSGKTNIEVFTSYGHVYKDVQGDKLGPKQFIVIHNKVTKKVKLVEVDSALLINSALVKEPEIKSVNAVNYGSKVRALSKTFGVKKMVSRIEQREKLNLDSTLFEEDIKETVSSIDLKCVTDGSISSAAVQSESITELLPPCNRNAQSKFEIYKLKDIFNEDEIHALQNESSHILESNVDMKNYSKLFEFCFEKAKKQDNHLEYLGGLLFVEVLIKFLKIPSNKLNAKNASFCSFSSVIHSKIANEFCVKSGNSLCRPLSIKDKSLCYIIVLTLLCCDYEINLQLIATTTSVHLNKLTRLARVVGAVPLSTDSNIFVLKIPLPALPKISNRTRKK